MPNLGDRGKARAERQVVETLELLARDQATRVRQILAETLRDMTEAPPAVIRPVFSCWRSVKLMPKPTWKRLSPRGRLPWAKATCRMLYRKSRPLVIEPSGILSGPSSPIKRARLRPILTGYIVLIGLK